MDNDGHPGTSEAPGRKGKTGGAGDDVPQYHIGLMPVIGPHQHAICHPVPLIENAFHLWQQHSPENELFTQKCVEHCHNEEQPKEGPIAHQLGLYLQRSQDFVKVAAGWRREKREH